MMVTAIAAALAAAFAFALSNSLQHRAASTTHGAGVLITSLVRRPSWRLGVLLSIVAVALQAVAVRNGPLVVVQPLIVIGIVLALPIRSALDWRLPSFDHLVAVALTTLGIVVFVIASDPTAGSGDPRLGPAVLLVAAGVTAAVIAATGAFKATSARRPGVLLGAASGLLSGLMAGMLKLAVLGSTPELLAGVVAVGALTLGSTGFVLNQRAYKVAPLALSTPVLNVVAVIVASTFGFAVFRETPAHNAAAVAASLMGIALMGLGLARLARTTAKSASVALPQPRQPVHSPVLSGCSR
jgi:drug/metabolite transporter (DMT)-like permease